jgi:hypothetical protein
MSMPAMGKGAAHYTQSQTEGDEGGGGGGGEVKGGREGRKEGGGSSTRRGLLSTSRSTPSTRPWPSCAGARAEAGGVSTC